MRCGALLDQTAPSEDFEPLPWWRRIFQRSSERSVAAGTRPRRRAWRRPRLAIPLALLLLVTGFWFGRSPLTQLLNLTHDRTGKPEALRPTRYDASSSAPGHKAGLAFDGANNRYWAPAKTGSGVGQYLEAGFDKPVRLQKVLITSGSSAKQEDFLLQARPAKVTMTVIAVGGDKSTKVIKLRDEPGPQTFDLSGSNVVEVRMTVDAAYGARPNRRVAIAEVEFFGRR
jgi:hypothetical protein